MLNCSTGRSQENQVALIMTRTVLVMDLDV